jgi:hypothetical protein
LFDADRSQQKMTLAKPFMVQMMRQAIEVRRPCGNSGSGRMCGKAGKPDKL